MCFSSTASFGISTLLMGGGIASLRQVKTSSQVPFASIPIIFAIQQFCEGFVWLSFDNADLAHLGTGFAYAFLAFAQVLWPFWVPLSMMLIEKNEHRKKVQHLIFFLGTVLSGYLLYCLLFFPVSTSVVKHHIRYDLGRPFQEPYITGVLYFIVTIVPPFLSSIKKMLIIGVSSLVSFTLAFFFFSEAIVSIWCFFAAAISVGVFLVVKETSSEQLSKQILIKP